MTPQTAIIELQRMTPQELRKDLEIKRAECAKLRLGLAMQSEKNSGTYRALRKEIARMCMVLQAMERGGKVPTKKTTETPTKVEKNPVKVSGSKKVAADKPVKKAAAKKKTTTAA